MTDSNKEQLESSAPVDSKVEEVPKNLNPMQVVSSVLAAGLGVQSSKNRETGL